MLEYRAEGLAATPTICAVRSQYHCITTGEVLQSTALAL